MIFLLFVVWLSAIETFQINSTKKASDSKQLVNATIDLINELRPILGREKETMGDVVFNVHHFTQFVFDGNQVYVYSPKKNDENIHEPQKWTFFYVPILQPIQSNPVLPWVSINLLEIRVRVALGTAQVEEAARRAISNQFSCDIAEKYSKLWVIAPLMLNSLTAYIVEVGSTPVPGCAPFRIDNPNSNVITFRFICLNRDSTLLTAAGLLTGVLDIEVAFYFSGMHRVKTNLMTITANHLQSVLSKTIADGGGTNSTYIHRDQSQFFISKYITNVKKLIYVEEPNVNISLLTYGLVEQLIALFHESMANARETRILSNAFGQVWHAADLNPDHITSEMGKLFTFNQSETQKHNSFQDYYTVNQRRDSSLAAHTPLENRIRTVISTISYNNFNEYPKNKYNNVYERAVHNAVSDTDIAKAAEQVGIEGAWHGHKFIPKAFRVFKLSEVIDRLHVAVIGKQLLAEKANGAVIRRVSALSSLSNIVNLFASLDNSSLFASLENASLLATLTNIDLLSPSEASNSNTGTDERTALIGEIRLYGGSGTAPARWLPCDGSIVSRTTYPRLFSIIGTKYGQGRDPSTFKLPDLRGRFPLGVDSEGIRVDQAFDIGDEGGTANRVLTIDQLPAHSHQRGNLQTLATGQHTHDINDPGHHHGSTRTQAISSSLPNDYGIYNQQANGFRQWQTINMTTAFTQISIGSNGNHNHEIIGQTSSVGAGQPFSVIPPFQTVQYIIYTG